MENYYKILEVDKDASPEIIEKAYKLLVKKYHPDLQTGNDKLIAEEKIKKINTAYDVLSNEQKRKEYNEQLESNFVSPEEYKLILNENIELKNQLNYLKNKMYNNVQQNYTYNQPHYSNMNTNYYYPPKNNKEKFKIKNLLKLLFSLLLTFIIIFICFNTPIIYNLFSIFLNSDLSVLIIIIAVIIIYLSKK